MYRQNPKAFTNEETRYLYNAASQLGIPMDVPGEGARIASGFAGGLLHGATAGLLPKDAFGDTPITSGGQGVAGVAEMLAGALVGGAVGKAGALALRSFGKGLIAKAGAAALAEKGAERLVAKEVIAGVKAGGEASSMVGKLGPLLQKAFNGDKMLKLAQVAKANPALAGAIESGMVGFGMGSWNDIFDNPAEALSQGLIGGAAFGGLRYYKGKKALSALTVKEGEGVAAAQTAAAAEAGVARVTTPPPAAPAGSSPIITPPPTSPQPSLPAVGAKMASKAQKAALERLGMYSAEDIGKMTQEEAMANLRTGVKGTKKVNASAPTTGAPLPEPPPLRGPSAPKRIPQGFMDATDLVNVAGDYSLLEKHAATAGLAINEVAYLTTNGLKPAQIERLIDMGIKAGKISPNRAKILRTTMMQEIEAMSLDASNIGMPGEDY
jgi:hypothetical protein